MLDFHFALLNQLLLLQVVLDLVLLQLFDELRDLRLDFRLPRLLRLEELLVFEFGQNLDGRDFQMVAQQLEAGPLLWVVLPAHLQDELEAVGARAGNRGLQFARTHRVHDGTCEEHWLATYEAV